MPGDTAIWTSWDKSCTRKGCRIWLQWAAATEGNVARTTPRGSPTSATLRNGEHGREDVEEMTVPPGPAHCERRGGVWTSSFADALLRHFGCSLNLLLLMILIILAAVQNNNDGGGISTKQQPITLREVFSGDAGPDKQLAQSRASQVGAGCRATPAANGLWGLGWPVCA